MRRLRLVEVEMSPSCSFVAVMDISGQSTTYRVFPGEQASGLRARCARLMVATSIDLHGKGMLGEGRIMPRMRWAQDVIRIEEGRWPVPSRAVALPPIFQAPCRG